MNDQLNNKANDKPHILFIVGSLRKKSLNRQLAEAAITLIGDRAETEILEWGDVPPFNQDTEFPAPEAVVRVREKVSNSDALWFATSENNHSIPGVLKNLIDWLSRPVSDNEGAVIIGKTATASTVAGGSCGRYVQSALLPIFGFLKLGAPAAPFTCISFNREEFTSSKLNVTDDLKVDLTRQIDALLAKLNKAK